jgi:hypothetical protein
MNVLTLNGIIEYKIYRFITIITIIRISETKGFSVNHKTMHSGTEMAEKAYGTHQYQRIYYPTMFEGNFHRMRT